MINTLSELFGRSPIKPIQQHMTAAAKAAEQLLDFFEASHHQDWPQAEAHYQAIRETEHQADELKMTLRLQLPKSLFLPVARQDLLELISSQDKVANVCKDISGLMLGRQMSFPSQMHADVDEYVQAAVATAKHALKAVEELDELLASGFKGKELSIVESLVSQLNTQENITDNHEIQIRAALFALEAELPPVDVMFYYRIIEQIGSLADRAQQVGNRLLLLVAQ